MCVYVWGGGSFGLTERVAITGRDLHDLHTIQALRASWSPHWVWPFGDHEHEWVGEDEMWCAKHDRDVRRADVSKSSGRGRKLALARRRSGILR